MHAKIPVRCVIWLCPLLLVGAAAGQFSSNPREVPVPEDVIVSNPETTPQWEGVWTLLFVSTVVADEGSPGSGVSALKAQFNLDDRTAATLFRRIQSALETRRRVASAARDDVCNRREQIVSREDLVKEVGKIRKASDDVRAEAVAQVESIVGVDAYKRIVEASDMVRSSMLSVDKDLPKALAREPLGAVAERTERMCGAR